ncbi:MAG: tetratricopeptide repeat protein [Planctomycetaceae bacterium]|nr:tetratricopeptide repeat protein [Planctomycetales bacterium]MCB9924818.1 tetratricopeptide repeat protein [Planctomycetaceae bacterium]
MFRSRSRTCLLLLGIALVIGLAVPARNRIYLAVRVQRARAALADRSFAKALEILDALNEANPQQKEVCYLLGLAHRRLLQYDKSFEYLQQAEQLGWPLSDVTRQRYLARFQAGDIEATQGYLYSLLQGGVDDVVAEEIYETLAQGYLSEARFQDAGLVLTHWIEWQPNAVRAHLWLAQFQETFAEDWNAAAEHYAKILEVEPEHREARLRFANALFKGQKLEQAHGEFQELLRRFPEEPLGWLGLGHCEQRLGNGPEAAKLFQRVTTADVATVYRAEAWAALGQMAMNDSQFERAVECFESALREDPRQVQTHHLLGNTYARLGQQDKAKFHLEQSQSVLRQNQRMSELADEITKSPQDVALRMEMAELVTESGDTDAAIRWLQTVIHIEPTHAAAREALANLFVERGMNDMAAAHRRFVTSPSPTVAPTTTGTTE